MALAETGHEFADMTNLSKDLRQKLGEEFTLPALQIDATQYSSGWNDQKPFQNMGWTFGGRCNDPNCHEIYGLCVFAVGCS
jgi:hypothetical protein